MKLVAFDYDEKSNKALTDYIITQNGYIPMGVNMINAPILWRQGYKGEGITIAVIDSGCSSHPDLKNNIIGGKNFTQEDDGNTDIFEDYKGHGTHVAGTIAGNGHILGVAPNSKLLILKVLDKNGNGNMLNVVSAINYAIQQKVDIISMSLGCPNFRESTNSYLGRRSVSVPSSLAFPVFTALVVKFLSQTGQVIVLSNTTSSSFIFGF